MSDNTSNINNNELTFEQAYVRLQEIYNLINNKDIIDISRLNDLQIETDKLYIYLQGFINKDNDKIVD